MRARAALLLLVVLQACGGGATGDPAAYVHSLEAAGALTGAVLLARGDTVILQGGFGLADEESGAPNTPQTRFRIGSITKQFTAMGVLILQDRGLLAVDDRLCAYLQSCPQSWGAVTLRELLTHTSGIPDYTNLDDFPSLIDAPATMADLAARVAPLPLDFEPGARFAYDNTGYVLLGEIIERLSGKSYADFLREEIFAPLGMLSTSYDENDPPSPEHASGYLSPGEKPVPLDMSEFAAAGALASTVEDLFCWDRALRRGELVGADALRAMLTPQVACPAGGCALSSDVGYGFGWFLADRSGRRYVYHWGRIDGFRSSNGFYPVEDVTVIVLSNLETVDTFGISTKLGELAAAQ